MLAWEKTTQSISVEVCCLYAHPTKMCLSELVYSISGLFGHDEYSYREKDCNINTYTYIPSR